MYMFICLCSFLCVFYAASGLCHSSADSLDTSLYVPGDRKRQFRHIPSPCVMSHPQPTLGKIKLTENLYFYLW